MKKSILILIVLLSAILTGSIAQNTWTQKADFGGGYRIEATGLSIGSNGYIGTGLYNLITQSDFWQYDPTGDTWMQKSNFAVMGRQSAVGFSIGSKGYFGTGFNGLGAFYQKDFWEYDPITDVWTQKADFGGFGRESATGFSIGSKGYIGIGYDQNFLKDFWEYDPGTNLWTQKADFGGSARYSAVGFSIGSKGYIGTGYDTQDFQKDFWEYDPGSDTWTQKADFGGTARYIATGFSIGNKGYIGTGYDGIFPPYYQKDFWEYDQATDIWMQKADFGGTLRGFASGFSIGGKGYIGTGYFYQTGFSTYFQDLWEYSPNLPTNVVEESENKPEIYPNPASDEINIVLSVNDNFEIEIFNMVGELIIKERNKNNVDISRLTSGVYSIKILQGNNYFTQKLIKQ